MPQAFRVAIRYTSVAKATPVLTVVTMSILRRAHPGGGRGFHHGPKDFHAVGAAKTRIGRAIGVGHEAENISLAITNAGDVFDRTVWICFRYNFAARVAVTENHLSIFVKLPQRFLVGKKTSFAVRDWHS